MFERFRPQRVFGFDLNVLRNVVVDLFFHLCLRLYRRLPSSSSSSFRFCVFLLSGDEAEKSKSTADSVQRDWKEETGKNGDEENRKQRGHGFGWRLFRRRGGGVCHLLFLEKLLKKRVSLYSSVACSSYSVCKQQEHFKMAIRDESWKKIETRNQKRRFNLFSSSQLFFFSLHARERRRRLDDSRRWGLKIWAENFGKFGSERKAWPPRRAGVV